MSRDCIDLDIHPLWLWNSGELSSPLTGGSTRENGPCTFAKASTAELTLVVGMWVSLP